MQQTAANYGRTGIVLPLFVVGIKLTILALAGERYGYMSDELYILDAARRPAAGYVDFPPLIAWLVAALRDFGVDSLGALRTVATILGIGVTLLAVDLCRLLGGGVFARWLTALVVLFAPGFLSVQSILTMNGLDQLWWMAAFWLTARFVQTEAAPLVLLLGVVLGLGLLTKLSILAYCAALPIALLIWYPHLFRRPALWQAGLVSLLIAAPYLIWQIRNDFPFIDFVAAYNSTPPRALVLQNPVAGMLLTMNPAYAVIWGAGALTCLFAEPRELRLLGTVAWICLAVFVLAGVKFYFAVPVFGLFTVAGALLWESLTETRWRTGSRTVLVVLGVSGILSIPAAAPVLPVDRLQQIANFMRDGEQGFPSDEPADLERYFPHFAEMHGWPELVDATAEAWAGLSPEQREGAVLVGSFYGHSAALNLLDHSERLPPAHGRHMSYHLWGRDLDYSRGLFVGFESSELAALFDTVEPLGSLSCTRCMARERDLGIHYVAGPRFPPEEIHDRLRRYDFF